MKLIKYILFLGLLCAFTPAEAQTSDEPNLIEKFRQKKAQRKAKRRAKAHYKELERNYKERQHNHYMMQDEKTRTTMRNGQKQARRQVNGRTHSWWHRMRNRL